MKYPKNQFETLLRVLKKLAVVIDIRQFNYHTLHYVVFQQFSEGQQHNMLYQHGATLKRYHQLTDEEKKTAIKWIDTNNEVFELYPGNCNDDHIETAVKAAIKLMFN